MHFFNSDPPKPSSPSPVTPTSVKDSLKDYKIVKNVGEGAFGEVYLARSRATDELFAIKSISKNFLRKQKKEHHVYQEKLILQSFDTPYIVKLFKTFQDEQKIYFVLENIPNGELSKCIRKKSCLIRDFDLHGVDVCGCRSGADLGELARQRSRASGFETRELDAR